MLHYVYYCIIRLGTMERWKSLASRVDMANARYLHHELAAMRTEFKAMYDRFFDYEIALEQSNVLDDHINKITVSYFWYYAYCTSHIRTLILKVIFKKGF